MFNRAIVILVLVAGCGVAEEQVPIDDTPSSVASALEVHSDGELIGWVLGVQGPMLEVLLTEGYTALINDTTGYVGGEYPSLAQSDSCDDQWMSVHFNGADCVASARPTIYGGNYEGWSESTAPLLVGETAVSQLLYNHSCQPLDSSPACSWSVTPYNGPTSYPGIEVVSP